MRKIRAMIFVSLVAILFVGGYAVIVSANPVSQEPAAASDPMPNVEGVTQDQEDPGLCSAGPSDLPGADLVPGEMEALACPSCGNDNQCRRCCPSGVGRCTSIRTCLCLL